MGKQATKGQVDRLAAKLGVEINDNSGENDWDLEAVAPIGMRFAATSTHAVVSSDWSEEPKATAWGALLADLKHGLEPCTESDCDWCEDERSR